MTNERRSGLGNQQSTVNSLVNQARVRQEEIKAESEGRDGRGKPGNAGEVGTDKRGQDKVTYYLPKPRQDLVKEIAGSESVSQTDIVEIAVVAFYNAWKAGRIDLDDLKGATKSLRVLWKLDIPDKFSFFSERTQL